MTGPEAALAACRFVHDAATMLLWGAFGYVASLVPTGLAADVAKRLARLGPSAVALSVATTVLALPLETAAVGDGWADALSPETLKAVLSETSIGEAWAWQAAAAALLVVTLAVRTQTQPRAIAAASGLSLATLSLTGHAAIHEGWLGLVQRCNQALHLLAGGAWLGALVPVLAILRSIGRPKYRPEALTALRRFSLAGHAAVALVLATGVVNAGLILGHWPNDFGSPYQTMLALKIGLVLAMVGLALANRYLLVPRMAGRGRSTGRAIRRLTQAEIGLGAGVLALVAVFSRLEPS